MEQDISIRLDGMNILEKVLLPSIHQENDQYFFDLKAQLLASDKKDMLAVVVSVNIKKIGEDRLLSRIICEFGFEIQNLDTIIKKGDDDKMIIPPQIEVFVKSIAIGSMRGIMYSEFRGTFLHHAVLPIIMLDTMKPVSGDVLGDENNPPINPTHS